MEGHVNAPPKLVPLRFLRRPQTINALRASSLTHSGGESIYRIKCDQSSRYAWVRSNKPWQDDVASWGLTSSTYAAGAAQSTEAEAASVSSWATFSNSWIDYMYISSNPTGNDDDRYFMGHQDVDCYQQVGVRCFKGSYSAPTYTKYTNCEVFLAVSL